MSSWMLDPWFSSWFVRIACRGAAVSTGADTSLARFHLTMHHLVLHFITSRIITQQSNAYWKNTFLQRLWTNIADKMPLF